VPADATAAQRAHGTTAATPRTPAAGTDSDAPLMASLAPFQLSHKETAAAVAPPPVPAAAPERGAHVLKLSLSEASWVEVSAADGAKLEYGLLPAGSIRSYHSDSPIEVRLGNCSGAQVESDGILRDLTPFRHANVAHFRLFSPDEPIAHID
jgi:cytoskeleton protein RodZ